jgi:hypothetical protein
VYFESGQVENFNLARMFDDMCGKAEKMIMEVGEQRIPVRSFRPGTRGPCRQLLEPRCVSPPEKVLISFTDGGMRRLLTQPGV